MTALQAVKIVGVAFNKAGVVAADITVDVEELPLEEIFNEVLNAVNLVDGELDGTSGMEPTFHLTVAAYLYAEAMTPHFNGFTARWYKYKLAWKVHGGVMTPVAWPGSS